MVDNAFHLTRSIRNVWRHRWIALSVAVVICALGWTAVQLIPDRYEAMARVYLDTQSMLGPVLKGLAVDSDVRQQHVAQITRRTLLSRPNLEKVARATDQDLLAKTPEDFERLLNKLRDDIEVKGSGKENIYVISYQHKDPGVAKAVVDQLLTMFVESTLGAVRKDTSLTEKFLDEQILEYQARLEAAEERLKEFKRKNIGLMPTEAGGYFEKLQSALERLEQARLELQEAERRRDELKRQIEEELPVAQMEGGAPLPAQAGALDERINKLEARLDMLRLQYTDRHPDVISVRRSIEELTRQRQALAGQGGDVPPARGRYVENPVYQELKIALGEAEAEVSALTVRVEEYEKRVAQLRELVETIPRVEAELARLNRDYDVNKKNYELLVSRRESTKISREAGQSVDTVQFKIIDPPVTPLLPAGPNRPVLYTLVLLLGLGGGVALAWWLAESKHTFADARELRDMTGLPVLGGVSAVITRHQAIQMRAATGLFLLVAVAILALYGTMMTMQLLHVGHLSELPKAVGRLL